LTLDDDVETVALLVQQVLERVTQVLMYCRIKIPEQGQVQNCYFSFEQQSKQNSNENEANNRTTNK
jgi:hypothetical protein